MIHYLMIAVLLGSLALIVYAAEDNEQGIATSEMVTMEKEPQYYPVVNCHLHMGPREEDFALQTKVMDETGMAVSIDLSGGTGEDLRKKLELAKRYPGRYLVFCGFPFSEKDKDDPDIGKKLAASLEESIKAGAAGCGEMGASVVRGYHTWDDPRLEPFWQKAVELRVPLNWHTAQPARYWRPESPDNRIESGSLYHKAPKGQHAMLRERDRVLEKHPDLIVIAAHSS